MGKDAGRAAWLVGALAASALGISSTNGLAASLPDPGEPEQAKQILADKIREQGHACDKAEKAYRDEVNSRPDAPEWILECTNASYRIRLRPDMAAEVETLKGTP